MGYLEIPPTSHNSLPTITSLNDLSRGYLKLILSGNGNFEDFINKCKHPNSYISKLTLYFLVKKYHSALRCNVVWRQNTVAYRCHTCGLNSCKFFLIALFLHNGLIFRYVSLCTML